MDIYHVWADKTDGITDQEWADDLQEFLEHLVLENKMSSYRITRCKSGFCSIANMPEWHVMMEFCDLAQLESTLARVDSLEEEFKAKHKSFMQFLSSNTQHALYQDWPTSARDQVCAAGACQFPDKTLDPHSETHTHVEADWPELESLDHSL